MACRDTRSPTQHTHTHTRVGARAYVTAGTHVLRGTHKGGIRAYVIMACMCSHALCSLGMCARVGAAAAAVVAYQ